MSRVVDQLVADTAVEPLPKGEPFDYALAPAGSEGELRTIAASVQGIRHRVIGEVIEIGAKLARAKAVLGHGHFGPWLRAEVRVTERSAQHYMRVAEMLEGEVRSLSHLLVGTALTLASPSTPHAIRAGVLERVKSGERVTRAEVVEQVKASKAKDGQGGRLRGD